MYAGGIGASLFLIAVGAILTFAVTAEVQGVDLDVVGVILMIVGGLGVLFSLIVEFTPWGPGEGRTVIRDREVVDRTERDRRED